MGDLAYAPFLTVVRERASADACQPSLHPFLSSSLLPILPLSIIVLFLLLLVCLSFSSSVSVLTTVGTMVLTHTCSFHPPNLII